MIPGDINSDEHEKIVGEIFEALFNRHHGCAAQAVVGRDCHVLGASGYLHQIDVKLSFETNLLLIECKYWNGSITPEAVLAFHGRLADIAPVSSQAITGVIATKCDAGPGAKLLANHFGIELARVTSSAEFAARYAGQVGIGEIGVGTEHIGITALCGTAVSVAENNAYLCPKCGLL